MSPELESALNRIGWAHARHHPLALFSWPTTLKLHGGLIAGSPAAAKRAAADHKRLSLGLQAVIRELERLSDDARASINLTSTPVEKRDSGWPDHVSTVLAAIKAITPSVDEWGEFLDFEASKAKRGGRKNEPAYRIAGVLAEIYLVGLLKMPTIGRREDGSGPSGLFGAVTVKVFAALDVHVADVFPPCNAAISKLTPERVAQLYRPIDRPRLSLFDILRMD